MATNSGAIGIDLGSNNVVIALVKRGGVEILANEASHRETQNVVGFSQNERFIGEQAALKFKSNFKNTIAFGNRFLGLKADCPFLEEEKKYTFSTLVTGQDNRLMFEVMYNGEKRQFYPEQIVAMMLQKVKQIINHNDVTSFDAVISVPSYYTEQERKALLDATKIAELKTMQLLNEHTATALNYGIFRKKEFDDTPRYVAFVDFGHTKTSAYLVSFTKDKMKVISQAHDRHLGARDMDWILYEYYVQMFEKANSVSIRKNDKARMKLLEALDKQRKVLSANSDAALHLEYLFEDYDLNHVLTRAEFEKMIVPVIDRFRGVLQKVVNDIKDIKLHSVEIVGGATRIPLIQKAIEETFKVESVSKTLNASECIARGCAIQAAILSPLFKVVDYGVEDINYYPIRCNWKFVQPGKMEIEGEPKQTSIMFDRGCTLPNTKSLNLKRLEDCEIVLTYDPVPPGADEVIAKFLVHNRKPKEEEFNVKVRIKLNENGILSNDGTQLIEDYFEEEKVLIPGAPQPVGAPAGDKPPAMSPEQPAGEQPPAGGEQKPAEPQYELKKKKKVRTTDLTSDVAPLHQMADKMIREFYEDEVKMTNNDRVIHETYDRKNELEAYIYNNRMYLSGGKFVGFVQPEEAQKIVDTLNETEKWLYGEGASGAKSVFISKLEALKKLVDPITKRFKEFELIPDTVKEVQHLIAPHEAIVNSADEKFAHITPEDRQKVLAEIKGLKDWISHHMNLLTTAPKHLDLPFNSQQVRGKVDEFIKIAHPITSKPKPAPAAPPKEEKPADKPAEGNKMETEPPAGKDTKMDVEK